MDVTLHLEKGHKKYLEKFALQEIVGYVERKFLGERNIKLEIVETRNFK